MKKLIAISIAALGLAANAGTGATQTWTSNYVQRVVDALPQGTGISAEEARRFLSDLAERILNSTIGSGAYGENDMTTTSNGVTTVYGVVQSNGVPVVVRREYDLRISLEYDPPRQGARIVSSALDEYPVGALFGLSDDGRLTCKTLVGTQSWFDLSNGANGPEIVYESGGTVYNSLFLGRDVQVAKYQRQNGEMKLVGTFTLEPYALTDEEFAAATDGSAGTNSWAATAQNKSAVIMLRWLPRSLQTARMALMAGASQGSCAIPFGYMGPGMIDYNEAYPPADDEYEWQPSMGYPPGAWEDPGNWHTDFPVTATFTETDDNGNTVTFTREIPNEAVWNAVKGNYDLNIPPWPYTYPKLVHKPKFKCEKYGHVWKSCVCAVCGEMREHNIPAIDEHESECSKCQNKDTELKMVNGDYKVEETEKICGEVDKTYSPEKHAGWHHTGIQVDANGNYPEVYCSCACGNFSEGRYVLPHRKTRVPDLDPEYVDENSHRIKYVCTRGDCLHEMYEYEFHNVEPGEEGDASNLRYNDAYTHWATGKCKDCKHDIDALVEHLWGYYGGDSDHKCKCPCFANDGTTDEHGSNISGVDADGIPTASVHEWGQAYIINQDDPSRFCTVTMCWRCGKGGRKNGDVIEPVDSDEDTDHSGAWTTDGKAGTETEEGHWCSCSGVFEAHDFSDSEPVTCDGHHGMTRLGGCGYNMGKGGKDSREGTDSTTTNPDGPTVGPGTPPTPPPTPPVPPNPPVPPIPPNPPGPPPNPDDPPYPPPNPPPYPPFPPPPTPYPGGGGDSGTVDPNSVTNNWTNVSAPYGGPKRPPPPWTL